MKTGLKSLMLLFIGIMGLQSCKTAKIETLWVSGYKVKCDSVAETGKCLNIYIGEELKDEKWDRLTSNIEGFDFEEGTLQKIKVKESKKGKKTAAGETSKYSLIEVLVQKQDPRIMLRGNWVLTTIAGKEPDQKVILPTMVIDIEEMHIYGKGGCNLYSTSIDVLTTQEIKLGNLAGTLKACDFENVESEYLKVLSKIASYSVEGTMLTFLDAEGQPILTYIRTMKNTPQSSQPTLSGKWNNTRITGEDIKGEGDAPFITFDLEEKAINGKDGCNSFFGQIEELSKKEILFSGVGSTRMMCEDMDVPDAFSKALNQVQSYDINRGELVLFDKEGNELLAFDRR